MPFIIEKAKDPLYKEGMEIGIEEGIEKGIKEGIEKGIEKGIEQGIEKGIKKGIEQGIEKGIEKGAQQERIALTKSLLKLGVEIKIIKEATGFSEEEIGKIKNSFFKVV